MFADEYKTIEAKAEASIEDRGWIFDAVAIPVSTPADVEKAKKSVNGDSCFAARIGLPSSSEILTGCGNEPDETAKTLLEVIDQAELTNILIVVTKNQAEGKKTSAASQRAWHDAALNAVQRTKKVIRILYESVEIRPGDENLEIMTNFIQDLRAKVMHIKRGGETVMTVKVRAAQIDSFKANLLTRYPKIKILA